MMTESRVRRSEPWIRSLGHPIRVAILHCLLEIGTATPTRLAEELRMPLPKVGYHVNVLRDARQLTTVRTTRRRGAVVHHYRLRDPEATRTALRLLDPSTSVARDPWERLGRALVVLRTRREAQGISRDALARSLRITPSYLARIERAETDPRFTLLLAIAHELGTTLGEVFAAAET
ncbi:MAG TPA: helix-turn-helix domain-containing protein [Conexibacter sp.]|nr:helix-turn-helix domain-containing protein [Conexibacter sp.]